MVSMNQPSTETVAAWIGLLRAQRSVVARVEARLKAAGLPPLSWYDALWELEKAGDAGLRPCALERAMLLEQYNLSRLVDRLHRKGLVEKLPCPEDRRGSVLAITETGRALRQQMWATYAVAIAAEFGVHFTPAEAATLAALLSRLD
jgi:DNA-binding MarR family transcriptional regulator